MRAVRFFPFVAMTAVCLGFILGAGELLTTAGTWRVYAEADESPAAMMARIEGPQSPNRQGLDPLTLKQIMEKYRVPGVSIAVIKDFAIHWSKGYGVADVTSGAPVTPETMFQAASISKPVSAMAVLRAVQDGEALARSGYQHDSEIVEAADRGLHSRSPGHVADAPQPHLRPRRRLRLSGLSPEGPAPDRRADSQRRETLEHRKSLHGAAAFHGHQVLGRRHCRGPARVDRCHRQAVSADSQGVGARAGRHDQQRL